MNIKKLFGNWTDAIKTVPVAHILLVIFTIIGIGEVEGFIDLDGPELILSLILSFIISCYGPLFLIHSKSKSKNLINRILQISSIILGGLYYILLINTDFDNLTYSEGTLYIGILPLVFLGIPLIIALFHKDQESKIRFSRTNLIVSMIFGGIAGSIIRGGVSGALGSIEALFDVDIDSDLYADIGMISEILLAGSFIFNFYLTFSENIQESNLEIKPFRLRRIFGSFIFLPLALIYLAIFGVYGVKILITGIRPKGVIVWLGIGYFSLGIITSYLIYPEKTKTLEIINKILYTSFIPISFMMIGAIAKRINQYGITMNRCFVCYIIAFIIIFSALSLIFPKKRLLSFISTLCILAFIAVYGRPLNASNLSFNSQKNRLETLLSKENISLPLTEGALKDINEESTKLIMGTLDGLMENYNKDKIINKIINFEYKDAYRSSRYDIREFLGVNTDYDYYYPTYKYRSYRQYGKENHSIDITGYSKILYFEKSYSKMNDFTLNIEIDDQEYKVDLTDYLEELKEKSDIYAKSELTDEEKEILKNPALILTEPNYKVIINSFGIEENREGETQIYNAEGYILIK